MSNREEGNAKAGTRPPFNLSAPAKITELVDGESQRGAILILSAYLEEILGVVIRNACVSDKAADGLLGSRRPAGDFDSRIAIALAFGLIHDSEAVALTALRKIRNRAAHFDRKGAGFDVLFDSEETIDQVGNLAGAVNLNRPPRVSEAAYELFVVACRLLATKVMLRGAMISTPPGVPSVKEIAATYRELVKGTEAGSRLEQIEALIRDGDGEAVAEEMRKMAIRARLASPDL